MWSFVIVCHCLLISGKPRYGKYHQISICMYKHLFGMVGPSSPCEIIFSEWSFTYILRLHPVTYIIWRVCQSHLAVFYGVLFGVMWFWVAHVRNSSSLNHDKTERHVLLGKLMMFFGQTWQFVSPVTPCDFYMFSKKCKSEKTQQKNVRLLCFFCSC